MGQKIMIIGALIVIAFIMFRIFNEDARLKYEIEIADEIKD